jgi:transposase-like protein
MLTTRGFSVTYETIRQWRLKFGRAFANRVRRRAPRRVDEWHLDEVVITHRHEAQALRRWPTPGEGVLSPAPAWPTEAVFDRVCVSLAF